METFPRKRVEARRGWCEDLNTQLGATILWDNNERPALQAPRHGSVLVHRDPEVRQLASELELEALPTG